MVISLDDFVDFSERTMDGYLRALDRLDHESVNRRPGVVDASSPFQLTTHAIGAFRWWTAHMVCGHPSDRNRDAEFSAAGTIAELTSSIEASRSELRSIVAELDTATELRSEARTQTPLGRPWTVGAALLHAYEELAQHLGHLEMTVDLLRSADKV